MFITLSIYSKNLDSLTNFLKFFYKFNIKKTLGFNIRISQYQKNKKRTFFSVLRSPHVNKTSQEQFEYFIYNKKIKIHVSQLAKFIFIFKKINIQTFSDINIKTKFLVNPKLFKIILFNNTNPDKFKLQPFVNHKISITNKTSQTLLKLFDINGEILLKTFS